ncbi:hypothetical protein [Haloferula sp.]|uniref:hypothetical protein n=1 Tax=Haloferula sp. TaxID=2497595 RepID=UPI00329DA095
MTTPMKADIIWGDTSLDGLYRSEDDGQNTRRILDMDLAFGSSNYFPNFITVVDNHVYALDLTEKKIYVSGLEGETPTAIVDTTATGYTSTPYGIASDGTQLFFAVGNRLYRCGLDGTNVTYLFNPSTVAGNSSGPYDAVIHGDWYYYTYGSDGVARVKLDGSAGAVIVDMDASFGTTDWVMRGVATDGLYLYWGAFKSGSGAIYRSNLDGTNPASFISTGSRIPAGVAASGAGVYFSEFAQPNIKRANLDGTGSAVIATVTDSGPGDIGIVAEPLPFFTVTFSEGSYGTRTGGGALTQDVTEGDAAIAPTITPDFGWEFSGWDKILSNITQVQTITAQYSVASHNVNFNLDDKATRSSGGSLSQTIIHGNAATEPILSANHGYVFSEWDMDFSSITSSLTVTALFGTTLNNSGPTDNAIVDQDREPSSSETPSTVDVGSLTLTPGIAFELGENETLQLNSGPLTIQSGASFTANGTINGSVVNAGLLRIPILNLPTFSNTGVILVEVVAPTTITQSITLNDGLVSFSGGDVTIDTPMQRNDGILSTDASLEITGDFEQTEDGALRMFVSGDTPGITYSQLESGGDVSLDGELQVVFEPDALGYLPEPGDTFDFVKVTGGGSITLDVGLTVLSLVESTQTAAFDEDAIAYTPFDSGLGAVIDPDDLQLIGQNMFTLTLAESDTVLRATYVGPDLTDFYDNAPVSINATADTVSEGDGIGTLIATLSASSPIGGSHTFDLVSGEGSADNADFSISGNQLLTAALLDFESQSERSIRLRATNQENRTYEKVFLVIVTNVTTDDDDGDNLTEAEELALGTETQSADTDGDGVQDGDEVNAWGTDPLNNTDRVRYTGDGISTSGSMVTIEWLTVLGKSYKVEGNQTIDPETWNELPGTINGTGSSVSFPINTSGSSYRFFRIKPL